MSEVVGEGVIRITTDESGVDTVGAGKRAGEGFTKSFGGVLKGLVGAAAVVAVAKVVSDTFVGALNFDAAGDELQATLGLTEKQSAKAGELAGKLYADNYGASLGEVQSAIGTVIGGIKGMRKASEADLQVASTSALQYADVFNVDIAEAVEGANRLISSGLAPDATSAFDLMTRGAQKVPAALRGDLADATDEYSQFFSQLGIGGEQAFSALVSASDRGAFGIDKAGDAVKEFTIRATDGSTASVGALKSLGLSADDMANDILAGGDKAAGATQKIIDGLLSIKDPAEQSQAAIALFGTPLEDLGTKNIPEFLTSLQGAGGAVTDVSMATGEAYAVLTDNPLAQISDLWRTVQASILDVGIQALPFIIQGFEFLMAVGSQVAPVLAAVASTIGAAFAGEGPAGAALTRFFGIIQTAVQTILPVVVGYVTGTLIPAFSRIAAVVVQEVIPPVLRFGEVFIQTVLPAVLKVVGFIGSNLVPILTTVAVVVLRVIGVLIGLATGFIQTVAKVVGFGAALVNLVNNGLNAVRDAVAALPGRLLDLGGRFLDVGKAIIGKFVEGLKGAGGLVSDIAGNIWDAVKGLLNDAIGKINAALEFKISLPGPDITINPPNIPALAGGGLVTRPTITLTGESGNEGVLPLTRPAALRPIIDALDAARSDTPSGGGQRPVEVTVISPMDDPEGTAMKVVNQLVAAGLV